MHPVSGSKQLAQRFTLLPLALNSRFAFANSRSRSAMMELLWGSAVTRVSTD
jgi:hypothetical protein